jgi:three-Cys-motif partner protein
MSKDFNPIQLVEDDGLPIMDVGNWAQKKYKLVGKYCDIFTTGMRNKWNLIYVDLFCGPGFVKNKQSGAIMKNSALIAMSLKHKFDFYVLNDMDSNNCISIEKRIKKLYPDISFKTFNYNANNHSQYIIDQIPKFNTGKPDLFFCFLDPFSLDLNFETIKTFADYQSDFLID